MPPVAVLLCKTPLVQRYDLSSLKLIICGSAPLGKETEEELQQTLKVRVIQGIVIDTTFKLDVKLTITYCGVYHNICSE